MCYMFLSFTRSTNALQFYDIAAGLKERQMEAVFLEGGVSGASNKPFLRLSVSI